MSNIEKLTKRYKEILSKAANLSKEIHNELELMYPEDKIKSFKNKEDFLEDINYECKGHSLGKVMFISETIKKYFE